jgi:hypothetical protein
MTEASESLHLVRECVCGAVGGVLQTYSNLSLAGFSEPNRGLGQINHVTQHALKKSAAALGQSEPSSMAKIARRVDGLQSPNPDLLLGYSFERVSVWWKNAAISQST